MALPWYNPEEQNYICIRKIVTDIISKGLRTVFQQEWNNRYQATLGAWDNTATSGQMLFNMENKRPTAKNYLDKYKKGNINEWDCTVLFDAILYSNSIGFAGLNPSVKAEVDNLRKLRNEILHVAKGQLPEHEFEDTSEKARKSFLALGLPTKEIDDIKTERKRVASFLVLPQHPSHEVICRDDKVSTIIDDLNNLRTSNTGKLTYFYISGNPGGGKSQLARQIGESYYSEEMKKQNGLTFVMTLNAKNPESLLQSYQDFARRLHCTDNVVVNIINSEQTTEVKIRQLRIQITTRIQNYSSWLIIVDNVEDLNSVSSLLPELGSQEWNGGQVLVTTQDSSHIPPNSSLNQYISLSPGMELRESCHLLATVSATGDDDPMLKEVAKVLDYQPLAMAAAAVYLKQVKESVAPEFSWRNYLQKLNEGKLRTTEQELRKTNPAYSQTMTTAVLLAVEKAAEADIVFHHAFCFLSMVSHQSLPLEIVINYVLLAVIDQDREQVGLKIRNSSLILSDECESVRLHRVIHDAVKTYVKERKMDKVVSNFDFAVRSFHQIDGRSDEKTLVPHLRALHTVMKTTFPNWKTLYPVRANTAIRKQFSYFGRVLWRSGEFGISKIFQTAALNICVQQEKPDQVQIAVLYRHLGNVCQALGELYQAKGYHERALDTFIKQLQPDHAVDVGKSYGCLGNVNHALHNLRKAKDLQKRAVKILTKELGPTHADVAIASTNLGNVYKDLGKLPQAKDCHERALDIRIKQFGRHNANLLIVYVNLATVHADMDDLKQAKKYYEIALDIGMNELGSDHVNVAIVYRNLANVYKRLGDLLKARHYFERALTIRMKQFGPMHTKVGTCYKDLENVNKKLGDLQKARLCHQRARDIQAKQPEPVLASYKRVEYACTTRN